MGTKLHMVFDVEFGGNFDDEDAFEQWSQDRGIAADLANEAAKGLRSDLLKDRTWGDKHPRIKAYPDVFRQMVGVVEFEEPIKLSEDLKAVAVEFFGGPRCLVRLNNRLTDPDSIQATYDLRIGEFVDGLELELETQRGLRDEILPKWVRSELRCR